MERYELKVKYEEIRDLTEQERYEEAAEVCNTIDWDKSKNINMLCTAGEVYERCGLLADSKAIYLRAYQLQPQSRIVIYRLAELSIKLRDYEDSIHFYKLYEDAAPYDVNLFVLRYKIYRSRGASKEVLISILEDLKENDYHERWAYELAKLYSEAGMTDKCVAECDEIDLWFGKGRYVRQALQLKKRYQPLTEKQQKKLDEAAPKPHKAEETLRAKGKAEEKQRKAQETYERLQPTDARAKEQAREQALDAAREARAAQLLAEAAEEAEKEDAARAEKDSAEFYGRGVWPQLQIPEGAVKEASAAKNKKTARTRTFVPPKLEAAEPKAAAKPEASAELKATAKPEASAELEAAAKPEALAEPKAAAKPEASAESKNLTEPKTDELRAAGEAHTEAEHPQMTENDILAANIARILGGKAPLTAAELRGEKASDASRTAYEDDADAYDDDDAYDDLDEYDDEDLYDDADAYDEEDVYDEADAYDDEDLHADVRGEDEADASDAVDAHDEKDVPDKKEAGKDDKNRASSVGATTGMWEKVTDEDDTFIDDYEMENPPEDEESDAFEEDDAAFAKKESAFHRMWRMTSGVVGKKQKNATKLAKEQDYDIQIKPVVVSRYDTLNLQKELAKGIRAIMNATETEEVEKTMEDMSRSMELSNIPQLIQTKRLNIQEVKEELERKEAEKEQAAEEEAPSLVQEAAALDDKVQQMLGEEYDGQIRLMLEKETVEKQITGQMSIADMFQSEEERNLAAAKKKALEQTEEYIDQLSVVVPLIDEFGEVPVAESAEDEAAGKEPQPSDKTVQEAQEILQESKLESREDIGRMIADLSRLLAKKRKPAEPEVPAETADEATETADKVSDVSDEAAEAVGEVSDVSDEAAEAVGGVSDAADEASDVSAKTDISAENDVEESAAETEALAGPEAPVEAEALAGPETPVEAEISAEPETSVEAEAPTEPETSVEAEAPTEPETSVEAEESAEAEAPVEAETPADSPAPISEGEQKKILSYFMKFDGVEGEITAFMEREKDNGESFAIIGTEGSGRMSLALRLMKVVIKSTPGASKRIAKLSADVLNTKPIAAIFAKLDKGTLIVEQAHLLDPQALEELAQVMEAYANAVRVILIGEPGQLEKIFAENPTLESYFTYTFHLHDYSNDELVEFAKAYADTKGYRIDEVAVLALYTRLAEAKNAQQAVMLGDVKTIVNGAIEKSRSTKGVKRLFENLLMKNVDDDGNLLLREEDFASTQAD